jgi:hypothetical protein
MSMQMELKTINVISVLDNEVQASYSYPNNPQGIEAAEVRFGMMYNDHNDPDGTTDEPKPTPEEIHDMFNSAPYDDESGFKIFVMESDTE